MLLAEDNAINRQVANEILQSSGVSVEPAGDGLEAVEKLWEGGYDAVLMDIQMPGMDGLKATRILREYARFDNLPIIAMTAHAMNGDREKSLSVGMQDYIAKPIEPSVLLPPSRAGYTGTAALPALSAAEVPHAPARAYAAHAVRRRRKHQSADRCRNPARPRSRSGYRRQRPSGTRLIRTRHYAIVFTDVEMPVMDGATLTHILRSDSRYGELPIIACTAISSPEEEEALLQKGFTAVLRKPFDVQAMQTALNACHTLRRSPAPSPEPRPRVEAGHAIREELEHLPGFSVRQGLDRVMGNLPLYVSLLFDFRRELAEADAEIRQARLRTICPPSGRPSTN
ncbi:MAG: response regulator [Bilophila wadsworthia]